MEGQLTQHLCTPTSAQLAPPSSMVFAREHLGKRLGSEVRWQRGELSFAYRAERVSVTGLSETTSSSLD